MKEMRILSPTAILGYGFPESSFIEGMKKNPHVIAVDGGSTDPGPHYLGVGKSFTDRNAVKRDMEFMIASAIKNNIPVIVGTCGGAGGDVHLNWNVDIVKEIALEKNLSFKMAVISSEVSKETVIEKLENGKIVTMLAGKDLEKQDVLDSVRIVSQIGHEPLIEALNQGAQIILAGRTYDPAVFSALAIKEGFDAGLATHLGKILECAAIASTPGSGSDCMMGYLREDSFSIEPLAKERKCTTMSVAAHTLYEKTDPYHLPGPGGGLDLTKTTFKQVTDSKVEVAGSKFVPTDKYFLKLEGAKRVGYRTISIGASKDPIFISQIDNIIAVIKKRIKENFNTIKEEDYFLDFKVYGKNGIMSMFENLPSEIPNEVSIVFEAVAKTQKLANTICSFARSSMLHYGYDGRKSTAGNLAFPFSPSDVEAGEVFNFSVYHLMEVDNPCAHANTKYFEVNGGDCNEV